MGHIFVKKSSKEGPILYFLISHFWGKKKNLLELGPNFQNFQKSSQISYFLTFVNCGHLKKLLLLPDLKIW